MRTSNVKASNRRVATLLIAALAAPLAHAAAPAPDAVIELWEQRWTTSADGGLRYCEKKHVRLNDPRAYGEFGDWRITYDADRETLELLTARTRKPDGAYRELPDYARVESGYGAAAGWPTFAGLRQQVLVMPAIEPGCVLEVEYAITRKPAEHPEDVAVDLRLCSRYPITRRVIAIDLGSRAIAPVIQNIDPIPPASKNTWTFSDIPAWRDEAHAPPRERAQPRFAFSTAASFEAFARERLGRITASAEAGADPSVVALAEKWTRAASDQEDQVRAIQEKLATTFNIVDFDPALRPATLRPANDVLSTNYGTPEEAAAAMLALIRAAGIAASPALVIDRDRGIGDAPCPGMITASAILTSGGRQAWDVRGGRIERSGRWNNADLMWIDGDALAVRGLEPWRIADESDSAIRIDAELKPDATLTGSAFVRLTGLFATPEDLRKPDAQRARVEALLRRTLPDLQVERVAVRSLGGGQAEFEAAIKSSKPLARHGEQVVLALADDLPLLADIALPLDDAEREQPVAIAGAGVSHVELTVKTPAGWQAIAMPSGVSTLEDGPVRVAQSATWSDGSVRFRRVITLNTHTLPPEAFAKLRDTLQTLRAESARTVIVGPPQAGASPANDEKSDTVTRN